MTRRGHEFDDIELVFRPIQKIHLATSDQRSHHQSRHTGEGRCPWHAWVPACAGKAKGDIALNHPNASKH